MYITRTNLHSKRTMDVLSKTKSKTYRDILNGIKF